MCPPNVAPEAPLQSHVQGKVITPPPSTSSAPPPPPPPPPPGWSLQNNITSGNIMPPGAVPPLPPPPLPPAVTPKSEGSSSSSAKPQVNADVGGNMDALFAEIREGFKLRSASRNDKSDDKESKKTKTLPNSVIHKQQDEQLVTDESKKKPAQRDIETQTVKTITTGDIETQTVETVPIADPTLHTKKSNNVLKCLAAISLLCAPFVAGLYFPAVLAWISGAASIAGVAVPVAICATFTLVAVASAAYIFNSIVSTANSKEKVNSEEKFVKPIQQLQGDAALREPTQGFEYNNGSDNVGHDEVDGKEKKPVSIPVTFGTQPSLTPAPLLPSGGSPPPPPPLPVEKGAPPPPPPPSRVEKGAGAPPPPPPPPGADAKKPHGNLNDALNQIKKGGINLRKAPEKKEEPEKPEDERASLLDSLRKAGGKPTISDARKKARDDSIARRREKRESKGKNGAESDQSKPKGLAGAMAAVLDARFSATHDSDSGSELSSSDSDSGWSDGGKKRVKVFRKRGPKSTPLQNPSGSKAGDNTPDSGHSSGDNLNQQKHAPSNGTNSHEKPELPPQSEKVKEQKKHAQQQKSQVPPEATPRGAAPATEVNGVEPSSVKARASIFGPKAGRGEWKNSIANKHVGGRAFQSSRA